MFGVCTKMMRCDADALLLYSPGAGVEGPADGPAEGVAARGVAVPPAAFAFFGRGYSQSERLSRNQHLGELTLFG